MNNNAKDRLIYDRIDCFVERYEYVSSRFPKLRKTYYNKLSDSLLLYKSKLGTDDDKLNELLLKYPYKQPNVITKISNRFRRQKNYEQPIDTKNCSLFE